MTDVGIMQGRLLPPFEGRFQAFPATRWRDEFSLANEAGLACIEWIYEKPHDRQNPLGSEQGIAELKQLSAESGVDIRSICADYYMQEHLLDREGVPHQATVDHLQWLMRQAAKLPVIYMVLPFVDASSLSTPGQRDGIISLMTDIGALASKLGLELHLETDLQPVVFRQILEAIDQPAVRMNFDIGNSASLGFDPTEELTTLGPYLGSVHVKDRALAGGTVPLGQGNADLPTCFNLIRQSGFSRHFVLQAARGEEGHETTLAASNRLFVERHMATGPE
ncbi:MAG: sugar phosphate isomerase/epimerase [Rhodospirillaceae bacterium]|jgi:L-ribulose-5-phosphate 3-epimerase|nr:sugar phosphate isomerase/epimerase [Rhodospirillaceae bacterium]MBT5245527.1 sugar phosphate isomerase/epimerase [Rhodospirillaceae bacterium]MBT5561009.1 sugar phosphate isomerase/epimerase [Rhodospirillaceae bacterium]MBT6240645.1 sugar phosphate isomerase/epimerase [Rhodospirillaceae bacterium]